MYNPFTTITDRLDAIELKLDQLISNMHLHNENRHPISQDELLFNIKELSEYLRCSTQTIHNLKDQGYLPYYKLSRIIYFKKSEIDKVAQVKIRPSVKSKPSEHTFYKN